MIAGELMGSVVGLPSRTVSGSTPATRSNLYPFGYILSISPEGDAIVPER